jgi:hypothetical protein
MVFDEMENEDDLDTLMRSNSGLSRSLARQRKILEQAGVKHELRLRYGQVIEEIADEITAGDFDLVVAGTHPTGEGKLVQWMMGDMTRELVEKLDRPILIVRTAGRAESFLKMVAKKLVPARWLR